MTSDNDVGKTGAAGEMVKKRGESWEKGMGCGGVKWSEKRQRRRTPVRWWQLQERQDQGTQDSASWNHLLMPWW